MHSQSAYQRLFAEVESSYSEFAGEVAELAGDFRLTEQGLAKQLDPAQQGLYSDVRRVQDAVSGYVDDDEDEAADTLGQPDPPLDTDQALKLLYQQRLVERRLDSGRRGNTFRGLLEDAVESGDTVRARVLVDFGADLIDTTDPTAATATHRLLQRARRVAAPPDKARVLDHLEWIETDVEPSLDKLKRHYDRRARLIVQQEGDDVLSGAFALGAPDDLLNVGPAAITAAPAGADTQPLSDRQRARAG